MLTYIFLILLISIFFLIIIQNKFYNQLIALAGSGVVLILSCLLLADFNTNNAYFQHVVTYSFGLEFLNIYLSVGLDGISIFFFVLSSFLIFLCILFIWDEALFTFYAINLLIIDLFLLLVFSVLDLLFFYIFFEAILIPMFIIIGLWGSRERKIRAVYLFFFYTFVGSICMLVGLIYIYCLVGTLNFEYLVNYPFSIMEQRWLWLSFFLSFSAKIPMFPLHIWLPEAHVEAPTVGSVLLAGILLKLGVYGFLRFSLTLFPEASNFFAPLVYLLCLLGVIFASLTAIRQTDLKRIIAYSSIAHMNLVTIGIFSFNLLGVEGSVLQSISHGFVSGALFFLIGIVYHRYHSRLLSYYGGLVHLMPIYSIFFLIFTMANIALPGTSSFIGEFLLLAGIYKINSFACFFAALGVILGGAYSLWVYNRIIFGNLKIKNLRYFNDLTVRETAILMPLLILVIYMGVQPGFFTQYIHMACANISIITSFL